VPLDKIVADLNIDMIGRSRLLDNEDPRDARLTDQNSVYLIGADKLSQELNTISEETNNLGERLRLDYRHNSDSDPERFYYRSDHYNYAKKGIPVIFYFTGVHRDYHRNSDTKEKLDYVKMERITRLILATGWRVANMDHRPALNRKLVN
jgi:Zn-dependent M28 family amino/carboxypeptidase